MHQRCACTCHCMLSLCACGYLPPQFHLCMDCCAFVFLCRFPMVPCLPPDPTVPSVCLPSWLSNDCASSGSSSAVAKSDFWNKSRNVMPWQRSSVKKSTENCRIWRTASSALIHLHSVPSFFSRLTHLPAHTYHPLTVFLGMVVQ